MAGGASLAEANAYSDTQAFIEPFVSVSGGNLRIFAGGTDDSEEREGDRHDPVDQVERDRCADRNRSGEREDLADQVVPRVQSRARGRVDPRVAVVDRDARRRTVPGSPEPGI